ncbi:MAG: AbrB/MazE/SpoVT family DNA-binding domain-containing protein [Deltaproteobacteria bacterium]|jgi:bifunctional DNA-binding transcriptional regulator/antitoxin component of YhaV-PrlF toxin-antitoxin module|nr:AbrB/MazE/SpoVT family DNA-binding domain-containing protein [Deltaproteobacteria bacterium]
MLVKVTGKNQLALPKAVLQRIGVVEYFDVQAEEGKIVLTPMKLYASDKVRDKLHDLGIAESDIADAIASAGRQQ